MYGWFMQKLYSGYEDDSEDTLEYGWVFGITFFLVLFLSQTLYIWIFGEVGSIIAWVILIAWSGYVSYVLLYGRGEWYAQKVKEKAETIIAKRSIRTPKSRHEELDERERFAQSHLNTRDSNTNTKMSVEEMKEQLEKMAHQNGALISHDALVFIANFGGGAFHILETVIERAKIELVYINLD